MTKNRMTEWYTKPRGLGMSISTWVMLIVALSAARYMYQWLG